MFRKLRGRLREMDIDQKCLAKLLGVNQSAISHRFTGITSWTLGEMYIIMDLIKESYEKLHEYFPKVCTVTQSRTK